MKRLLLLSLLTIIISFTACGTTSETQTVSELPEQTVSSEEGISPNNTILPEQTPEVTPTPKPTTTPKPTASPTPVATATPTATPRPTPTPTAQPVPTEAVETLPVENLEGNAGAADSSSVDISNTPNEQAFVDSSISAEAPAPETASTAQGASSGGSGDESNFNTYDNAGQQNTEAAYVLNTNTMKIHHPSCKSVKKIAPQNYSTSNLSVDELIGQGYSTCGNCFK